MMGMLGAMLDTDNPSSHASTPVHENSLGNVRVEEKVDDGEHMEEKAEVQRCPYQPVCVRRLPRSSSAHNSLSVPGGNEEKVEMLIHR